MLRRSWKAFFSFSLFFPPFCCGPYTPAPPSSRRDTFCEPAPPLFSLPVLPLRCRWWLSASRVIILGRHCKTCFISAAQSSRLIWGYGVWVSEMQVNGRSLFVTKWWPDFVSFIAGSLVLHGIHPFAVSLSARTQSGSCHRYYLTAILSSALIKKTTLSFHQCAAISQTLCFKESLSPLDRMGPWGTFFYLRTKSPWKWVWYDKMPGVVVSSNINCLQWQANNSKINLCF